MIGAFNPYTAGASPQSPNISLDTVSQLLGGANAGVQALVGGINKAGEIDRSSKINELLATGGFKGLTEEQQRAKVAELTGGRSLNPIVGSNVADVLATQKAREVAQADTIAKLGLEDRKTANDLELEKLKSQLGLTKDTAIENIKSANEMKAAEALFGHESRLLGQKGGQAKDLAKFENDLKVSLIDQNKLPDRFISMGKGLTLDRVTGEVKKTEISKEDTVEDVLKTLSPEAQKHAKNLTKTQQENLAEALKTGNIGYKPYSEDKKTGAKSGGFFYDANNPTGLGITISNKKRQ